MKLYSKETSSKWSNKYHATYRKCAYCGDMFKGVRADAKYCSYRCVNDAYIERRRERARLRRANAKACAVCGSPVEQASGFVKIRRYCSNACKQKAYRKRKKKKSK
jgi:predicted nucleic acid-binding Zn ribbon protein